MPPATLTGTDSSGMTWTPNNGVVPLISTPASLTSTIGNTIPALPDSNPTALAVKYPSAFPSGYAPFGLFTSGVPSNKQIYFCAYVCLPTSFNSNSNNIKWIFFAQNGSNGRNHVFMLESGAPGSYRGPWMALQGGGGSFNVGGTNNTKPGATVNLASPTLLADGQWHVVEWYAQMETVNGVSGNGIYKAWIDGTLIGYWNNINFSAASGDPSVFDTCYFAPYYGGGGGAAPSDQYICMGRFMCAVGN